MSMVAVLVKLVPPEKNWSAVKLPVAEPPALMDMGPVPGVGVGVGVGVVPRTETNLFLILTCPFTFGCRLSLSKSPVVTQPVVST